MITAAGLIMAASMYGLVFASLGSVVQGAFVLGTGLLLDTFLVRTVTVPAIAVLVGQANWWLPSSWRPATWWPLADAVAVPNEPNVSRCCPRKKKSNHRPTTTI